ncbi:alkaline phosphatase [Thalassotalea fusca]
MKKLLPSILSLAMLSACANTNTAHTTRIEAQPVKNIIMIVADGMGPAYTSAYRYYNDDPSTEVIEQTVFERHLVGSASTYPAPISGYVTDSAAGATALASGIKSYNGAIGVDVNKQPVKSVLHAAKAKGMKTGVVVTSQVNHATPASYITHNESRRNYNQIADSYVDNGINTDLLLGGGTSYFIRDDRNLVEEYKAKGFQYIDAYQQLNDINTNQPVLGLFAPVGLPWSLDDTDKHRLSTMTKAATEYLINDSGYFLLIEASQVDWAGHANDVGSAMAEMDDLAKTLEYLEDYVQKHPNTLVVLTADHSTGGFTIAANGKYKWDPTVLRTLKQSTQAVAKELTEKEVTVEHLSTWLNTKITQDTVDKVNEAKTNALKAIAEYEQLSSEQQAKKRKPNVTEAIFKALTKVVDELTNTGWTSSGHTGIDVPVIALGAGKEAFIGGQDNTDIAKKIFKLLK